VSIDFGTSEVRMKKITKYKGFCEWKSKVYMNIFIKNEYRMKFISHRIFSSFG